MAFSHLFFGALGASTRPKAAVVGEAGEDRGVGRGVLAPWRGVRVEGGFGARLALFVALLFLTAFYGLGAIGVFDLDEGLYATASRQMVESGNFVVPYTGEQVRFAKPPLIYWIQAPSLVLGGNTALAVRVPSALCVTLTALLLWGTLARCGRERAGWIAAMAFVGSPLSLVLARQGIIDALLALCFTGVVLAWLAIERGYKRSGFVALGVCMGLSILAKSTIGLLLPLGAFVTWQLMRREPARAWVLPTLGAAVLALIVAAPWHLAMWHLTGDRFWQEAFVSNQIQRARGQEWGHVQPWWFYGPVLVAVMFPWSALVPVAWAQGLRAAWRRPTDTHREITSSQVGETANGVEANSARVEQGPRFEPGIWAWWALVVIVFFSISRSKLPGYIFPVVPALAVLVGWRLDELWRLGRGPRGIETFFLVALPLAGAVVGGAAAMLGASWRADIAGARLFGQEISSRAVETIVLLGPWLGAGALLFGVAALVTVVLRSRPAALVVALTALSATLALLLVHGVGPYYEAREIAPLHALTRRASQASGQEGVLAGYDLRPRRPSIRFVFVDTGRVTELEARPELEPWLARHAGRALVIARFEDQEPARLGLRAVEAQGKWRLWASPELGAALVASGARTATNP